LGITLGVPGDQTSEELRGAIEAAALTGEIAPKEISIQAREIFEGMSGGVVRPGHALEAARSPDDVAVLEYQGSRISFSTKAVHLGEADFVVLAVGNEGSKRRLVQAAYRLYDDATATDALAANALQAFQELLERYAQAFESKGRRVLFVPIHTAPVAGDVSMKDLIASVFGVESTAETHWGGNFQMKVSNGTMTMAWPFLINLKQYTADARQHGWRS
jgi:hypothetical protein